MRLNVYQSPGNASAIDGLMRVLRVSQSADTLDVLLTTAQWELLAGYLQPFPVEPGHTPIQQGASDRSLYLIESGTLTVHVADRSGRLKLAVVGAGSVVGEGAFFSGLPRCATVVATAPSMLWCLTQRRFQELSAQQPALALQLTMAFGSVLARRLKNTTARIAVT